MFAVLAVDWPLATRPPTWCLLTSGLAAGCASASADAGHRASRYDPGSASRLPYEASREPRTCGSVAVRVVPFSLTVRLAKELRF